MLLQQACLDRVDWHCMCLSMTASMLPRRSLQEQHLRLALVFLCLNGCKPLQMQPKCLETLENNKIRCLYYPSLRNLRAINCCCMIGGVLCLHCSGAALGSLQAKPSSRLKKLQRRPLRSVTRKGSVTEPFCRLVWWSQESCSVEPRKPNRKWRRL